jgi:hypothetical protein
VCIDDATRLGYSEILANERKESAVGFLERALGWFAQQGVTVERVMTDNGSAYLSGAFRAAVAAAGLKHKRTRPYTPRTNGKAERFIQTSLREWAYTRPYTNSQERRAALAPWLDHLQPELFPVRHPVAVDDLALLRAQDPVGLRFIRPLRHRFLHNRLFRPARFHRNEATFGK